MAEGTAKEEFFSKLFLFILDNNNLYSIKR